MPRTFRAGNVFVTGMTGMASVAVLASGLYTTPASAMSCSILNVSSVRYGAYDVFARNPVDSAGVVAFRCTSVVAGDLLSIQLSRGGATRFTPRAMRQRDQQLEYNLYLDAARTVVWGDGTSGTTSYTVHPTEGQAVSLPIYGRIPARQNVAIGAYHDDIVLTVLY